MYENDLIYGRDKTTHIVSTETRGSDFILYRELEDGSVVEEIMPATYWLMTNRRISAKQDEGEGNQFYKYMARFDNLQDLINLKSKLYQKRIDFYNIYDNKEANLVFNGVTYFKGMKPDEVSILSFDLETTGIKHDKESKVLLISNTFRRRGKIIRRLFALDDYNSEADMLLDWCKFVRECNPAILCGHNILNYDLFYLKFCADRNGITLNIGRDGSEIKFNTKPSKFRKDGSQEYEYFNAHVYGREIIDTMFMSIKHDVARKFPSYGLKPIIKFLELEKEGRTFVDASKIKKYYEERKINPEMWEKVKAYADDDSDDALKLYDKMIPATFYFAQSIPKSFQQINNTATGSQINSFLIRGYIQEGHSIPKATELTEHVQGGISFAVPGIYRNLLKIDLKSCYPSQVLRFKLYDKEKDPKGYFYQMVHHFTYERFDLKKKFKETNDKYFYDREQTSKVFINSAYGVTNTPGLNFNSPKIAAKITFESRAIIDFALTWASGQGKDYWIQKFREKTGKEIEDGEVDETL